MQFQGKAHRTYDRTMSRKMCVKVEPRGGGGGDRGEGAEISCERISCSDPGSARVVLMPRAWSLEATGSRTRLGCVRALGSVHYFACSSLLARVQKAAATRPACRSEGFT